MSRWVPVLAILSWAGLFVHNVADLPGHTILHPESLFPLLAIGVLIALWFTPVQPVAAWGLLSWGILNLVGAITTVLPLAILPFEPEQTPAHYAFHLLYGISQMPVIVATAMLIRRGRNRARGSGRNITAHRHGR